LFVAVPKGKIIEGIIQKAVELGAQRIVPLLTERVMTQLDGDGAESRSARNGSRSPSRPSSSAARRGCRASRAPVTLKDFLARGEMPELALVGSLQTERRHPREWSLRNFRSEAQPFAAAQGVGVWIGPEGDFTLEELRPCCKRPAQNRSRSES
jgi:16S rRNA (uracil1498-N3)-methyltransferase